MRLFFPDKYASTKGKLNPLALANTLPIALTGDTFNSACQAIRPAITNGSISINANPTKAPINNIHNILTVNINHLLCR